MRTKMGHRTLTLCAAIAVLVGVVLPVAQPFSVETASAASPDKFVTVASNDEYLEKRAECVAVVEQGALNDTVINNALKITNLNDYDGLGSSGGLFGRDRFVSFSGDGSLPAGWDGAQAYVDYLKTYKTGEQMPLLKLYSPQGQTRPEFNCGDVYDGNPRDGTQNAGFTFVPVAGTGPNPTLWVGVQFYNEMFDAHFISYFQADPTQTLTDGLRGTMWVYSTDDHDALTPKKYTLTADGVPLPGSAPVDINTTYNGAVFSNVSTITLTREIDADGDGVSDTKAFETYVDPAWDAYSFYFLAKSVDANNNPTDRNNITYTAKGIAVDSDPFCNKNYGDVPFIFLPTGWKDGPAEDAENNNPGCNDYARGLINLKNFNTADDFQKAIEIVGHNNWGLHPRIYDYQPSGVKVGPQGSGAKSHLPNGSDIYIDLDPSWRNVWFYGSTQGDTLRLKSVWSNGGGLERRYIGLYEIPAGKTLADLAGGNTALEHLYNGCVAGRIDPSNVTPSGSIGLINIYAWEMFDTDSGCQPPAKQSTRPDQVLALINQEAFDDVVAPPEQETDPPAADPCTRESGAFGWVICPSTSFLAEAATAIDKLVLWLIKIDANDIFVVSASASDDNYFRIAWLIFRNIAYALLVILGLIMVVSQVAGLDFFDAYSIRKMLPKLVAATIIIPLLWPILEIVTNMANDSADAIGELIKGPFQIGENSIIADWVTGLGLTGGAIAAGITFAVLGGTGVVLALVASVVLAILQAFVVIAARDLVFYILVIVSPVAVALAIFEPFKKGFDMWRKLLTGILLSIPAVAAVLAASKVGATIAQRADYPLPGIGTIFEITFIIVGYIMFWPILKSMDKVAGQIDGIADKVTSGAQKALAKYRGETMKRRWHEYKDGRRGSLENPGNIFNPRSWARRAANAANGIEDRARPGLASPLTRAGRAQRKAQLKALKIARHQRESLAQKEEAAKFGETFSGDSQLTSSWLDAGVRRHGESQEEHFKRAEDARLEKIRQRTINGARAEGRRSIARQDGEDDASFQQRAKEEGDRRAAQAETEWDAGTNAEYEKKKKDTVENFWEASAKMAAQAGVEMGGEHFVLMAAHSAAGDSTAYRSDDFESVEAADQALAMSLGKLIEEGVIDDVMAMKMYSSNKERMDRAAGAGQNMGYLGALTPKKIQAGAQALITEAVGDPARGIVGSPDGDLAHLAVLARKGDQKALIKAAEKEYVRRLQLKQSAAVTRGNSATQTYSARQEAAEERAEDDARVARMLTHIQDITAMGDKPDLARVRKIATEIGVPHDDIDDTFYDRGSDTDAAHRIQERVVARITSDMAAREDLAFDKNNIQRSPAEAMVRHLARLGAAYQYMLHIAPQNRDHIDAKFASQKIRIPRTVEVPLAFDPSATDPATGKPYINDGGYAAREVQVPTGRRVTRSEWDATAGQYVQVEVDETRPQLVRATKRTLTFDPKDQEITVLEALERAKSDPLLAAEMKKLGYDMELSQRGRVDAAADPMASMRPPF